MEREGGCDRFGVRLSGISLKLPFSVAADGWKVGSWILPLLKTEFSDEVVVSPQSGHLRGRRGVGGTQPTMGVINPESPGLFLSFHFLLCRASPLPLEAV